MDGAPLTDKETFSRLMAEKRWGDSASFVVRRGSEEVTLKVVFRRSLPQEKKPEPPAPPSKTAPKKK
jgi:S1-C subfamily serine protease